MSHWRVDVAPAVANGQLAIAADHTEDTTELGHSSAAVLDLPELLVMVLSHLTINDLSRALSVSKQWNETILDSVDLRRTLFLEPKQGREYLRLWKCKDQWCYKVSHWKQPPKREPAHDDAQPWRSSKIIVEPHPSLARALSKRFSGITITLPNFGKLETVPASAYLFQPPLDEMTISHWGRESRLQISGGVTFGAVRKEVEVIRAAFEQAIERSPCFTAHLRRDPARKTVSIRTDRAFLVDSVYVKVAQGALAEAKESAVLDGLEGTPTWAAMGRFGEWVTPEGW